MESNSSDERPQNNGGGMRLIGVILIETVLVAIGGLLVWGVAWELNFPTVGLVAAIIIWLTVSPIIEIATVMNYRKSAGDSRRPDSDS